MRIQLPLFSKPMCKECAEKPAYTKDGLCRSCCQKGTRNHFFGKNHTRETQEKMSANHSDVSGDKNPRYKSGHRIAGEKNPNWKNGLSQKPYHKNFKKIRPSILERDAYMCQRCGAKSNLAVHHINYDRQDIDPANLITLCKLCNSRVNTLRYAHYQIFSDIMIHRNIWRTTPESQWAIDFRIQDYKRHFP